MRTTILVLTFAVSCAASPALAQARVLTLPVQSPQPSALKEVQRKIPTPTAADKTQYQTLSSALVQPPAQTKKQASSAIMAAPQPTKLQDKIELGRHPMRIPPPPRRFNFKRVDNGFLRFDRESGKVMFCSQHNTVWGCETVPEHRAALEREIASLRGRVTVLQVEVAALKKELADLSKPPAPPRPSPPSPGGQKSGVIIQLPNAKNIAQARSFIEDTWRQLQQMIQNMQKDIMRKS